MQSRSIFAWIVVGAIAGWLAGHFVRGAGFGLVGDIVVGVLGACVAGYVFPHIGIRTGVGIRAAIIDAFLGAVILLVIVGALRHA